jgi:hypothetical protein
LENNRCSRIARKVSPLFQLNDNDNIKLESGMRKGIYKKRIIAIKSIRTSKKITIQTANQSFSLSTGFKVKVETQTNAKGQ